MGHFIRIHKCCGCCGSLRAGSIAIGVFYLIVALCGASIGGYLVDSGLWEGMLMQSGCSDTLLFRIWKFTSLVSVFVNLALVYGALTEQALIVASWLAWHLVMPLMHVILIIWSALGLTRPCTRRNQDYMYGVIFTQLICLLPLLYFATVVYSLYQDLLEGIRSNNRNRTNTFQLSRNWYAEMTPHTNYDPEQATPTAWGNSQPLQQAYQAPVQGILPLPHPVTLQQTQASGIPRPRL